MRAGRSATLDGASFDGEICANDRVGICVPRHVEDPDGSVFVGQKSCSVALVVRTRGAEVSPVAPEIRSIDVKKIAYQSPSTRRPELSRDEARRRPGYERSRRAPTGTTYRDKRTPDKLATLLFIVAIRFHARGRGHAGITMLKTVDSDGSAEQTWTQQALVSWLRAGGEASVSGAGFKVFVLDGTPPYLRAFDATRATDALLKLPRF